MNEHLKSAIKVLSGINYINNGGCGISALAIYRYLRKKEMKSQIKFIYIHDSSAEYRNNKNYLKAKKENDNSSNMGLSVPSHIVIRYCGKYFDSDGKYSFNRKQKHVVIDDEKDLLQTINKPYLNGWSHLFNRKVGLKSIQEILNVDMSDVAYEWD